MFLKTGVLDLGTPLSLLHGWWLLHNKYLNAKVIKTQKCGAQAYVFLRLQNV